MDSYQMLELLARVQEPRISKEDAKKLASSKFSYFLSIQRVDGNDVSDIEYIYKKFPNLWYHFLIKKVNIRICFPEKHSDGRVTGQLTRGDKSTTYSIELFGSFEEISMGKPGSKI